MNNAKQYYSPNGFTFIEVLVFLVIISMVLLTGATFAHRVTKANQINLKRIVAAHGADELAQWLRFESAYNWNKIQRSIFPSQDTTTPQIRCVPQALDAYESAGDFPTPALTQPDASLCHGCLVSNMRTDHVTGTPTPVLSVGQIYRRCAQFERQSDGAHIRVRAQVEWDESGGVQTVPIELDLVPDILQ